MGGNFCPMLTFFRGFCFAVLIAVFFAPPPSFARGAVEEVVTGAGEILGGAVSLPVNVLAGTAKGPLVLGTLNGLLVGAARTIGMTTRGVLRMASGTVPLLLKALPFAWL